MFENYPTYIKQILAASKNMSVIQKARVGKMGIATISTMVLGGLVLSAGGNTVATTQVDAALDTLKTGFQTDSVVVEVEAEPTANETLFTEDVNPLSVSEEATLIQQVKDSINSDRLSSSDVVVIDANTVEVTVVTADDIPVKIVMKTDETTGTYSIESAKAILTEKVIQDKKAAADNPDSTDEQKSAYAAPLHAFEAGAFETISGIGEDADLESEYDVHVSVIAPDVVLTVPANFEWKEVEQPADDSTQADETAEGEEADNESAANNVNAAIDNAVNEAVNSAVGAKAEDMVETSHMKQYARSWKDGAGSTISVRAENLGTAFSNMNGLDAITKMKGYWEETLSSVATGANQELKNPEEGYYTELFYDAKSGCWGYWGHVEYTDGTRNITYNRVAMIDEVADQMFTISYRNDCEVDGESHAYTLEEFKKIVTNAPVANDSAAVAGPVDPATVEIEGIEEGSEETGVDHVAVAMSAYKKGLDLIEILPGHSKTVAEETAAAAEAAAAAEQSETGETEDAPSEETAE